MRAANQLIKSVIILGAVITAAGWAVARQEIDDERTERIRNLLAASNPLPASDSMWIEELTFLEVRDRVAEGATTAIIPAGGIEENGPYLATGKHNVILEALCPAIAKELGNALCAPIVPFVPPDSIDPPSVAMHFPRAFAVTEETYRALLEDVAGTLMQHGFQDIVFIGDSGGNQDGMRAVARMLNARWDNTGVRAHFIGEYYSPGWEATEDYTEEVLGVAETTSDGYHDDIWVTAMMMVTDPASVRHQQRVNADLASINGVDISSLDETIELGQKMVEFRARFTADAIRSALTNR